MESYKHKNKTIWKFSYKYTADLLPDFVDSQFIGTKQEFKEYKKENWELWGGVCYNIKTTHANAKEFAEWLDDFKEREKIRKWEQSI